MFIHSCGVDMEQAEEDGGTSPVHITTAVGNLDVLKFMHEHGVNMEVRGAIYLNTGKDGAPQLHSSVTHPSLLLKAVLRQARISAWTFFVS